MLTQRSEGLRRLLLICQIWITAGLFWLGVWVMVKFYSPDVRPFTFRRNQTCPHRVPAGVFKFFCLTFIVPQSMIAKISLPMDPCDFRSNAFEVANQV